MASLMDGYGSIHFGFIVLGCCTGSMTGHKTLKHITDLWPTAPWNPGITTRKG